MRYFSSVDISSAYYSIGLTKDCRRHTAFWYKDRLHQLTRLPMGMAVSAAVLENYLTPLFADIPGVFVYVDDILITSHSFDDHLSSLRAVLNTMKEQNLGARAAKVQLCKTSLSFLGIFSSSNATPVGRPQMSRAPGGNFTRSPTFMLPTLS